MQAGAQYRLRGSFDAVMGDPQAAQQRSEETSIPGTSAARTIRMADRGRRPYSRVRIECTSPIPQSGLGGVSGSKGSARETRARPKPASCRQGIPRGRSARGRVLRAKRDAKAGQPGGGYRRERRDHVVHLGELAISLRWAQNYTYWGDHGRLVRGN